MTPTRAIDELVWSALTDSVFRGRLLGGRRRQALAEFRLSDADEQAVLAVKADTLEAFAEALCGSGSRGACGRPEA